MFHICKFNFKYFYDCINHDLKKSYNRFRYISKDIIKRRIEKIEFKKLYVCRIDYALILDSKFFFHCNSNNCFM